MQFEVSVDLSGMLEAVGGLEESFDKHISDAVIALAYSTRRVWADRIDAARLWDVEKKQYMKSLQVKRTGKFSAEVWTDLPIAEQIEGGRPARDLKKMLDTSLKVRISAKGTRYLYIPFRHNIPAPGAAHSTMSESTYDIARTLAPSAVTGRGQRNSGTGAYDHKTRRAIMVPKNTYHWGDKLDGEDIPRHQRGMYRFDQSGGGPRRSEYLTFRTMSENSRGWIVKARAGLNIARDVASHMNQVAPGVFAEAISRATKA